MHLRSSKYNPLFFFPYNINGTPCEMVFTSVSGHLLELDFLPQHKKWRGCNPVELYTAPVQKLVPQARQQPQAMCCDMLNAAWCANALMVRCCMLQDKEATERNLQQQARDAQWLVLWLDCDREGENIAFEVLATRWAPQLPAASHHTCITSVTCRSEQCRHLCYRSKCFKSVMMSTPLQHLCRSSRYAGGPTRGW